MKTLVGQTAIILLSALILSIGANLVHPRKIPWIEDWNRLTEARAWKEKIAVLALSRALDHYYSRQSLFIDARSEAEYQRGHITGALSLPFSAIHKHLDIFERVLLSEKPTVLYCRNSECDEALMLALELRDMGKSNLFLYIDGFEIWEKTGAPTEAGP